MKNVYDLMMESMRPRSFQDELFIRCQNNCGRHITSEDEYDVVDELVVNDRIVRNAKVCMYCLEDLE